jgi:hypothetical protein
LRKGKSGKVERRKGLSPYSPCSFFSHSPALIGYLQFIVIKKDILFLGLLTLNVMECAPGKFDIEWFEIALWIWIFAAAFEEGIQYAQDRGL